MRNSVSRRIIWLIVAVVGLVAVAITSAVSIVGSEYLLRAGVGTVPIIAAVIVTAGLALYLSRRADDRDPPSAPEQLQGRGADRLSGAHAARAGKGTIFWRRAATVVLTLFLVALILAGVTILFPMR